MGSISSAIELQDNFTGILLNVIDVVNKSVSAIGQMQSAMDEPVDTAFFQEVQDQIAQATVAAQELHAALQGVGDSAAVSAPALEKEPVAWQGNGLEVFTNSGAERFQQEVQGMNSMLEQLSSTQDAIARQAYDTNIFPPSAFQDLNELAVRIDMMGNRIQQMENNPINFGTDAANAELEQMRGWMAQAVQEQENLNHAIQAMDVQAANEAYLKLSQTVGNTERHIRDNVDEQGRFRREIDQSTDSAEGLKNMIAHAVGAFAGIAGLRKAFGFVQDCTEAFNTQLNAETQLISVLANMLDEDYVAQFELDTVADTTGALDEINAVRNSVDEVVVPVTAETKALTAAYEQITAKAAEIQSRGIYGDEIMIAAAAEFSTYFTDTNAIEMMMDTLTNYAMGMSGGGEIDASGMVNYATNLGKIMSGSYDAMTKKGFEFTDAQKAIIEGEATREQIVSALGEEYIGMSADMQAAAAITQVIDEAWAGLYEGMSSTPEGKIIQLNNAWGDMKEVIGGQLYPYVMLFVDMIENNWGTIEGVVSAITTGLEYLLGVLSWLMESAINFAQVAIDNWSWISPIIYGIIGALAVYGTYLAITKGLELASAAAKGVMAVAENIHAAAIAAATGATMAEVAAQEGLNAAMHACPIVWIIVLIIALIAIFYAAVAAVNHFTDSSISATGLICGAFAALGAFLLNTIIGVINAIIQVLWAAADPFIGIIEWILNVANGGFDSFGGAVASLVGNIISWFLSLGKVVAKIVDSIFGTDWTSGLNHLQEAVLAWGKNEDAITLDRNAPMIDYRISYSDAWDAGYSFGEGIDESIANFDPSSLFGTTDIPTAEDYISGFGDIMDSSSLGGDVKAIKNSMDITEEDLKYLRDIAEQETVNRFTTAEITIEQTNHNTIKNGMDLDGVMSSMTDMVNEAIEISTEGVHD